MFSLLKLTFSLLPRPRPFSLTLQTNVERSPTDVYTSYSFGKLFSPIHFRRSITRTVIYYELFKGLLLLGKPPDCLSNTTSFIT